MDTPLNRDELWLLDHLASDKHYNCLNALCRNLREHFGVADGQIPPLLQSMQKLRVSGFLDAYVKHQFSEHRPGDVLLYDSGRNAAYAGKKLDTHDKQQQLLTGSSTSHVGVIGGRTEEGVAKRLDSYDNMIVYKDLDAGRSYYTSAWRLDVSKMVSPQLGQVLGAAGITDELLQNAYQNVCKQVARNENEQYWPNNARNDLDRRNRSVIPRLPKLGGSYERIANMQRPTMICSEFSMRYEVAVILQLQQNLREILVENPAAQQEAQDEGLDLANMPLFELPLPPNTKMKALHPGKVEKIFQNLLDSGAMSEVRKPPRHIPPPPQAPPPAAAAPPPAAVPPIQNPVQAAPVDEARSDVEDEQQEPYHPEVDDF